MSDVFDAEVVQPGGPDGGPGAWRAKALARRGKAGYRRTPDRVDEEQRNVYGFLALIMGVCSWVPLVIVVAAPLTVGFAALAIWHARRKDRRRGLKGAYWGLFLAGFALVLHFSFAAIAVLFGWLGGVLGIGGS